jgi:hypothetical protein
MQLREHHFEVTANKICKSTNEIIGHFTAVVKEFGPEEMMMDGGV